MDAKKEKRGPNFTELDKELLINLANDKKNIIENKKTDGCTWREKETAWKQIENLFNSCTTGVNRNAKQLKFKYDAIKRDLKKDRAQAKAHARGTGGGVYKPPPAPKTEAEAQLLQTIEISAEGLMNFNDSDGVDGIFGIEYLPESRAETPEVAEREPVEVDWSNYNPQMLRTPIHQTLATKPPGSTATSDIISSVPSTSTHQATAMQPIPTSGNLNTSVPSTSTYEDKPSWVSRRRPSLQPKKHQASASARFEELANKKIELVNILIKKETENIAHQKATNEVQMEILLLQKEEMKLKIELLNKSLDE